MFWRCVCSVMNDSYPNLIGMGLCTGNLHLPSSSSYFHGAVVFCMPHLIVDLGQDAPLAWQQPYWIPQSLSVSWSFWLSGEESGGGIVWPSEVVWVPPTPPHQPLYPCTLMTICGGLTRFWLGASGPQWDTLTTFPWPGKHSPVIML